MISTPPPQPTKPLITHIYTADPSAHVFEGKIYIYPSHDLDLDLASNDNGDQYQMTDYHVFSQPDPFGPVQDHGEVLHVKDVAWAKKQMWAPDAAHKDGRYYLYFPAKDHDGVFRIGVAVAPSPYGPFVAEKKPIAGSFSIDPCVFRDDDGAHYLYFGGLWGGQLQNWAGGKFDPDAKLLPAGEPALCPKVAPLTDDMLSFSSPPRDLCITDESARALLAGDNGRRFFEGPWMHKHRGTYYFSYSTGDTHQLVYATGKSPLGPFQYRGVVLTPPIGWTTHHSIVEFEGRWFLYYHDASLSGGVDNKRSVKVQELFYKDDGTIITMNP